MKINYDQSLGWKSQDHKDFFDVWNLMSKSQFNYLFSSFEENKYLVDCLKKDKINSILDYGCASGYLKRYLTLIGKKKIEYNGYDISEISINHAKKNYGENIFFSKASELKKNKYDLVYSRDTVLHQEDPWKFIDNLVEKTKKKLILRLRTRDHGETQMDSNISCQLIPGDHWVPYMILNYNEFLDKLKKIGFNHIRINRSYTSLGGKNNRYLEKSLYLKKTGTSETSVLASFENDQSSSSNVLETFNLEGHNYFETKKYLTLFFKFLNKLKI